MIERAEDTPTFWVTLSFSAGRERSFTPAATRHHFIIGAQKNTVLGPRYARPQPASAYSKRENCDWKERSSTVSHDWWSLLREPACRMVHESLEF